MVQKGASRLRGRRGPNANSASTEMRRQNKVERAPPAISTKPPLPSKSETRRTRNSRHSANLKNIDETRDPPAAAGGDSPARRSAGAARSAAARKKSLGKSIVVKQQPMGRARSRHSKKTRESAGTSRVSASTITSRDQHSRFSTFDDDDDGWDSLSHSGPQEYDPLQRRNKQRGDRGFNDSLIDQDIMKACLAAIDCSKMCTSMMMGAVKSSCDADPSEESQTTAKSSKPSEWTIVKEMLALPIDDCRTSAAEDKNGDVDDVARNLWSYYRGATGCVVVNWKYEAAYKELKKDPLWPYLKECPAINDESSDGKCGGCKHRMVQVCSQGDVYASLAAKAAEAQPALIQICKTIAKKLKLTKIGVGPIKDEEAAKAKAKRKYDGNLLNVTDYCRAFLVVDDIATLLALLEYLCRHFSSSICRIKLSSLCGDKPHPGGYRDCKINLMVKGHICEIQLHLRQLYDVSSVDGYQHYKDWLLNGLEEYENGSDDSSSLLNGLSRKMLGDVADISEETTKITSVTSVARDDEAKIVDYIAVAGLLLRQEESFKAEVICRQLISLRTAKDQSPTMESNHPEIIYLERLLETALRQQNLMDEADTIARRRDLRDNDNDSNVDDNDSISVASFFGGFGSSANEAKQMVGRKEMERSKQAWLKVRQERFRNVANYDQAHDALTEVINILKNPAEVGKPSFAVTTSRVEADDATGVIEDTSSRASTDATPPQISIVKVGWSKYLRRNGV